MRMRRLRVPQPCIPFGPTSAPWAALGLLALTACGGSDTASAQKDTIPALFGVWQFPNVTQGVATVSAKATFSEGKAVLSVTCSETGGESGTAVAESKAEFTATTYKILENKDATKVVNGSNCYASWKKRTVTWSISGDTLKLKGDDGLENQLTRAR